MRILPELMDDKYSRKFKADKFQFSAGSRKIGIGVSL